MPPAYTGARYPFSDLEALVGAPTIAVLAWRLGFDSGRRVLRLRESEGLTEREADELATAAGLHPRLVWPSWGDERARNASRDRRAVRA